MGRTIRFQPQLDGSPTAGEDCGVRALSMGIDYATYGALRPAVKELRRRMGVYTGATKMSNLNSAIETYDDSEMKPHGYTGLKMYDRYAAPFDDAVATPLANGHYVIVQVDYEVVNKVAPRLSGDPNFQGNHSVGFRGTRINARGVRQYKAFDPLCDGRREGIPKGPQWWPENLLREAAAAFAGRDKATSGRIMRAKAIAPPTTPDPEPPDPCAELKAALKAQTERAEELEALFDAVLLELGSELSHAAETLRRASDIIDEYVVLPTDPNGYARTGALRDG